MAEAGTSWRRPPSSEALEDDGHRSQCVDEDLVCCNLVREPLGGAHHDPVRVFEAVHESIAASLDRLLGLDPDELVEKRFDRLQDIGALAEEED